MSAELDDIFKALRVVPEFDGNPHVLTRFIRLCDSIVIKYVKPLAENELQNLSVINGILNKITGPAARTINSNGIPDNWLGIRNVLINNFTDQRDETALYNDLALQTQDNQTPQEFYDKCMTLFSTIMTYISLHESLETTIVAKRDLYKKLTLQAFVRGLKEPLGSRIRCMRPETIEKALEYVQEELNVLYLQQRDRKENPLTNKTNFNPQSTLPMHSRLYQPPKPFAFAHNHVPHPSPNMRTISPMPPNYRPPYFRQQQPMRMPTNTQQMFGARPPNYNPNSNMFRLPNNNQPKPMSGVSHYVAKPQPPQAWDWTKRGNPPPSNYFKSRDVNLNECYDNDDSYYYPDFDYNCYYHNQYEPTYCDNEYPYYPYHVPSFPPHFEYSNEYDDPQPSSSVQQNKPTEEPSTSKDEDFQILSKSRRPK